MNCNLMIIFLFTISTLDFSLIAKLTKEPPKKKVKDGEEPKPASPVSRSGIKQALRLKCNSVISLQKKKVSVDWTSIITHHKNLWVQFETCNYQELRLELEQS